MSRFSKEFREAVEWDYFSLNMARYVTEKYAHLRRGTYKIMPTKKFLNVLNKLDLV